ncbi:MAG: hypothetical protein ACJAVT_002171 [Yoonia sp.]|jgi:hypothetical protein
MDNGAKVGFEPSPNVATKAAIRFSRRAVQGAHDRVADKAILELKSILGDQFAALANL